MVRVTPLFSAPRFRQQPEPIDIMNETHLEDLADRVKPAAASNLLLWVIVGFFATFVIWASVVELDRTIHAEGRRLSELLSGFNYFFDAHRAVDDCEAGIALLTMKLPKSGERVLSSVLKTARQPTWRIFADAAPFEMKDVLKHRGYKWNADRALGPRAWWKEVPSDLIDAEVDFLQSEIFRSPVHLPMFEITAFQRYSMRAI